MLEFITTEELYENAPCGYFSFIPSGKIIRVNKTFRDWLGITQEDLDQLHFIDILQKGNSIYYEMIFLPMLKMQGYVNEISFDIIKKDGTTFPALLNAVAVRDKEENLKAVNVTLINITDRKKYERELLRTKKDAENERLKFEILANQIPDIIWTASDTGRVEFLNEQFFKITGKNNTECENLIFSDLIFETDQAIFKECWEKAKSNNQVMELEVRLKNNSKNPDWYLLRGIPYSRDSFAEKEERSWLGTLTNINQQIKSLQLKDDFIAIASHELKTPVTIVKSYLQILQKLIKDETHQALLKKCESGVNSMSQLIANLLDITYINSEELPIVKDIENLVDIVKRSIDSHRITKSTHQIDLIADVEHVYVNVDRMRIEQVINNLLSNAIKYSKGADRVVVKIEKPSDDTVRLSVRDFGIGISEEDLSQVFDRYFRVKSQNTSYVQGWGLGLYIIQQIMKSHNSLIHVESEEGKGSCFSFELKIVH